MTTVLSVPAGPSREVGAFRRLVEFARYFIASAGALCVDAGLYKAGLQAGMDYRWAALIGFVAGAVVAYLASILWVFEARSIRRPVVEFTLFVAIGLCGLLLTELLLWVQIQHFGWSKFWSKGGSAAVVFIFNFGVRKTLLFNTRKVSFERPPGTPCGLRSR